jgi:DedD protein
MRSLLDTEEEEEGKASEITLSTASLLGIFFGLVLICGVFFGFGYSMGRGNSSAAQAAGLGNAPASKANDSGDTAAAKNPPVVPSAEQQDETPASVKAAPAPAVQQDAHEDKADKSPAKPVAVAISKPSAAQQQAAYVPPADAPPSATGQPMVQIAAVARREDADVLVSALRQRGYGVVVRNEPQDKLLHVQVGPFANRVQAAAIKEKLLSDGYNAIIKQ